jgi:hypothetical protein
MIICPLLCLVPLVLSSTTKYSAHNVQPKILRNMIVKNNENKNESENKNETKMNTQMK